MRTFIKLKFIQFKFCKYMVASMCPVLNKGNNDTLKPESI